MAVRSVDTTRNGKIDFDGKFVVCMLQLIEMPSQKGWEETSSTSGLTWHQLSNENLDLYLQRLFCSADTNGDGMLQQQEFLDLLVGSGLKLPPELLLDLFLSVNFNEDGLIQYDDFFLGMKEMLVTARQDVQAAEVSSLYFHDVADCRLHGWQAAQMARQAATKQSQSWHA